MRYFPYSIILSFLFFFTGCYESNTIGEEGLGDDKIEIVYIDTVSIETSTVLIDSLATSDADLLVIGGYEDQYSGKVKAKTYFQVSFSSSFDAPDDAIFDSLVLVLTPSGYSYGDTTANLNLVVSHISEDLEYKEIPSYIEPEEVSWFYKSSALYNTSNTATSDSPLASVSVNLRPHADDSVVIRLPDELGLEWLGLAMEDDTRLTSQTDFIDYFKGISIAPGDEQNSMVAGFNKDSTRIRLYYKTYENGFLIKKHYDFEVTESLLGYNQLTSDRSSSYFKDLEEQKILPSLETSQVLLIQSGVGTMVKLSFPYLQRLNDAFKYYSVHSAYIEMYPVAGSFDHNYLPSKLVLFQTNKLNIPLQPIGYSQTSGSYTLYATLSKNNEYNKNIYYFPLTEVMQELLNSQSSDPLHFLLSTATPDYQNKIEQVVLGSHSNKNYGMRLKLYLTVLNN